MKKLIKKEEGCDEMKTEGMLKIYTEQFGEDNADSLGEGGARRR
nr:hypothetical protein [Paenibacillus borealis]